MIGPSIVVWRMLTNRSAGPGRTVSPFPTISSTASKEEAAGTNSWPIGDRKPMLQPAWIGGRASWSTLNGWLPAGGGNAKSESARTHNNPLDRAVIGSFCR